MDTPPTCHACGGSFPAAALKNASLPSLSALAAVWNWDPDATDPLPWNGLSDRHVYCPVCRFRVNARRVLGFVLVAAFPLVGYLVWRYLL